MPTDVSYMVVASVTNAPDRPVLSALNGATMGDGQKAHVLSDLSSWTFRANATASPDASGALVLATADGVGRWLRADAVVDLSLPVDFTTLDGAAIWSTPAGARLRVRDVWLDVATSWSGGTLSTIGIHSSVPGFTTKGDLLGGALGDAAAGLLSSLLRMSGTVGAKLSALASGRLILIPGDTINFGRIASAFTAGAANVRVTADVIQNAGS